jgi:hypothetical protein
MENFEEDIIKCKLLLDDGKEFIIPMTEDGYIFGTDLCKAAGKRISNWIRLKEVKDLVSDIEKTYKLKKIIEIHKGNSCKHIQGTWIHPELAIKLA